MCQFHMSILEEANKAVEMFNEQALDGRNLRVNIAKPREERPPRREERPPRREGGGRGREGGSRGRERY